MFCSKPISVVENHTSHSSQSLISYHALHRIYNKCKHHICNKLCLGAAVPEKVILEPRYTRYIHFSPSFLLLASLADSSFFYNRANSPAKRSSPLRRILARLYKIITCFTLFLFFSFFLFFLHPLSQSTSSRNS